MFRLNKKRKLLKFAPAMLVILGMLIFNISPTNAYFSDMESSVDNIFQAGSLGAELLVSNNFSPAVTPSTVSTRSIVIDNIESLEFQYDLAIGNFSGDISLCNNLNLIATLGSTEIYNGALNTFDVSTSTLASSTNATLNLEVGLPSSAGSEFENKICNFDLKLDAWQTDFMNNSQGFFDTKTISNTINSGAWVASPGDIVINEFLPNPSGSGTDGNPMPDGEWVELYNRGGTAMDVAGWVLYDVLDIHPLPITTSNISPSSTIIQPNGFLIVYLNGFGSGGWLNNDDGDTVRLYSGPIGTGLLIDSHAYTMDAPDNKSFARIPDGSSNWVDPIPTPGGPNRVEEVLESGGGGGGADIIQENMEVASTTPAIIEIEPVVEVPIIEDSEPIVVPEPIIEPDSTSSPQAAPVVETPAVEPPPTPTE